MGELRAQIIVRCTNQKYAEDIPKKTDFYIDDSDVCVELMIR